MKITLLTCTPAGEQLIDRAAAVCYNSELKSDGSRICSCIQRGHTSVLEHATATFLIQGISRACSHQLVRHRLASFSQRSQRYCDTGEWEPVVPPEIADNEYALSVFNDFNVLAKVYYTKLRKLGIKKEDARFVLPNATPTSLVMTANLREWRHIISLRADTAAQWEIRQVAKQILVILYEQYPIVFEDLYNKFLLQH